MLQISTQKYIEMTSKKPTKWFSLMSIEEMESLGEYSPEMIAYLKSLEKCDTDPLFPEDDKERQQYPIGEFVTCFFPRALAELSKFSVKNQQKHNPEGPLGWAKDKSIWSINRIFRHGMEAWFAWMRGDHERCREELLSLAWRGLEGLERFLNNMEPFDDK